MSTVLKDSGNCLNKSARIFGKSGRPVEDRLLRRRQIFEAVAPLLLDIGARRLSMEQAANAAALSVGGLYH